ncbi:MAG: hypothetical protein QM743_11050 [Chitinophagaceae bacterium]
MSRFTFRNVTGFILLLLLGGVFIFSALTKFISIEPFEWTFMDLGLPAGFSFFLARFFIGFEFALALMLIAHLYLRSFTYKLTQLFLSVMTVYLLIILATKGNNVDCGCFGDTLPMSPAVSIGKNILLMAWTYLLQRIYTPKTYRFGGLVAVVLLAASFALPYVFVPYEQKPTAVNIDALYKNAADKPSVELRKGKHMIAFMSLGCPHCRNAARIFKSMFDEDSTLPVMMILYGDKPDTADFFKDTKANKVPHFVIEDGKAFKKMAGSYVPNIFWINNGIRERKITYVQLNTSLIKNWDK